VIVSPLDSKSTDLGEAQPAPAGVLVRKPRTSVYTVMLGLALGAIMLGCLFLAMEIMEYGSLLSRPWVAR
jgi:hypothetical protein